MPDPGDRRARSLRLLHTQPDWSDRPSCYSRRLCQHGEAVKTEPAVHSRYNGTCVDHVVSATPGSMLRWANLRSIKPVPSALPRAWREADSRHTSPFLRARWLQALLTINRRGQEVAIYGPSLTRSSQTTSDLIYWLTIYYGKRPPRHRVDSILVRHPP
jgi:5-methylcytosine-specific restriction endonuclease McrA